MAEFHPKDRTSIDSLGIQRPSSGRSSARQQASGLTRRDLLAMTLGLAGGIGVSLTHAFPAAPLADEAESRNGLLVRPPASIGGLDTRTKIVVEVDGQLQLKEPDPSKAQEFRTGAVKGKSTLEYLERIAFSESKLVASAHRYTEAKAENWIQGSTSTHELRPECRETRLLEHKGVWQQLCESESLDLRETELLHSPINSAALELLLPNEPAKPTSVWSISSDAAQLIFNLEAVHKSSLTAKITKVEKGIATIAVTGELDATANSVPTSLDIQGNIRAQYSGRCVVVTWLGLAIKEKREISQAEPGFSVTARIRIIREVTDNEFAVTEDELRQLAAKDNSGKWLIRLTSPAGRYTMLADRSWKIYIDSGQDAILRMIENNTVIAQCNVTPLPKMDSGSQLTMEGLQAEIRQSLEENFEQFLQSNERVTTSGLRLLRCVAMGSAEDVPVQWIYHHLSDDNGRRIAMVFTMGGNVTDKFAAADEQMAASFELLPELESEEQTPTPAPTAPLSATKNESQTR